MSYQNVFSSGGTEAQSAKQAADHLWDFVPGAKPEREGVDPELYEGITESPKDPRTVSDRATVALNLVENLISPMFANFDSTSVTVNGVTEDSASTSKMASSTVNDVATNTTESIPPENVVIPSDQNPQNPDSANHPPVVPNPQDQGSPTRPADPNPANPQDPNSPNRPATPTRTVPEQPVVERMVF